MKSDAELNVLREELKALNAEFFVAMEKRKAWMDAHMTDFARYQVGDEIFAMSNGARLGVVSKLYRYWGSDNRDPQYDTEMNIEYEYCTGNNCYDNTSRRPINIMNRQELDDWQRFRNRAPTDWNEIFNKHQVTEP